MAPVVNNQLEYHDHFCDFLWVPKMLLDERWLASPRSRNWSHRQRSGMIHQRRHIHVYIGLRHAVVFSDCLGLIQNLEKYSSSAKKTPVRRPALKLALDDDNNNTVNALSLMREQEINHGYYSPAINPQLLSPVGYYHRILHPYIFSDRSWIQKQFLLSKC